jgi:SAM-dependent methyltransferase
LSYSTLCLDTIAGHEMNSLRAQARRFRRHLYRVERLTNRGLSMAGMKQSESRISTDAQKYWEKSQAGEWKSNSHWRGAGAFVQDDVWLGVGERHLGMFERGLRLFSSGDQLGRVLEWGCGGGANAVHFAPKASEFIGVDISADSLEECREQVEMTCDTPFKPVKVDVEQPEAVLRQVEPGVDAFVSFYVFECLPSPEYGMRILNLARELLREDGMALIQVKYQTSDPRTRPLGRGYREGIARMTTYSIDTFWELAASAGLKPEFVEIVPKTELDARYAYYLLRKPSGN